jgi:acyl dehydratase
MFEATICASHARSDFVTRTELYYEDVEPGAELPAIIKVPTTIDLVHYCAAANDFSPIHFDEPYARSRGMQSVIVQGFFKAACLGQLLTDWAGPRGWVKKIATKYQRVNAPNDPMTCRGRVLDKSMHAGEYRVEVEIWLENGQGEVTTNGQATVVLPSRLEVREQPTG